MSACLCIHSYHDEIFNFTGVERTNLLHLLFYLTFVLPCALAFCIIDLLYFCEFFCMGLFPK